MTYIKNNVRHEPAHYVYASLYAGNNESKVPVTMYGGKSGQLFYSVIPVKTGIGNPVTDSEETFKQKFPYFRACMPRVTGVHLSTIYEISFSWGENGWKFMEPNAMCGCAQTIFQSKSPAVAQVSILPYDYENAAPQLPLNPVVIQPD